MTATNPQRSSRAKQVKFTLTARQTKAWEIIETCRLSHACELLFGGAKYGGKTYAGCIYSFLYALWLIEAFKIAPSRFPLLIGFMGRKVAKDFYEQTLEVFKQAIPTEAFEIRGNPPEVIIGQAVKFITGGFDRGSTLRFKGQALCWAFVDQAEELTADDIAELRAHTFWRMRIGQVTLPGCIYLTANPAACWIEDDYDLSGRDTVKILGSLPTGQTGDGQAGRNCGQEGAIRRYFVQALPSDNDWLDPRYLETIKTSFQHRPELLSAYLYGSWDHLEGADIVIKKEDLARALATVPAEDTELRRIVACDPARLGSCETVIYCLENGRIIDEQIFGQRTADATCAYIVEMAWRHAIAGKALPVIIDADGLGGPIADWLGTRGLRVIAVHGAGKSQHPTRFHNLRAQIWWEAGSKFAKGQIALKSAKGRVHHDPVLHKQLCSVKYSIQRGRILIESKTEMLAQGRPSPDRADAYVLGLYGLDLVEPVSPISHWIEENEPDRQLAESYVTFSRL